MRHRSQLLQRAKLRTSIAWRLLVQHARAHGAWARKCEHAPCTQCAWFTAFVAVLPIADAKRPAKQARAPAQLCGGKRMHDGQVGFIRSEQPWLPIWRLASAQHPSSLGTPVQDWDSHAHLARHFWRDLEEQCSAAQHGYEPQLFVSGWPYGLYPPWPRGTALPRGRAPPDGLVGWSTDTARGCPYPLHRPVHRTTHPLPQIPFLRVPCLFRTHQRPSCWNAHTLPQKIEWIHPLPVRMHTHSHTKLNGLTLHLQPRPPSTPFT